MKHIVTENFNIDENTVVTLGNFDGLHRGHMALINKVFEIKKEKVEKKGFLEAVRILLSEKNMLFESLREKLESYPELNSMLYSLLFTGKAIV